MRSAAALVLVAGCSTAAFDDLRDQATSESHAAPDGVSIGFGADVAFVPSPSGVDGMRFVVAGDDSPSLSTFVYGLDQGEVFSAGIDLAEFVDPLERPPRITGVEGPANNGGLVAFGMGELSTIVLLEAGDGRSPPVELGEIRSEDCGLPPDLPDFGERIVLADLGIGSGAPDLVVAAGNRLTVIQDVDPAAPDCASCTLPVGALGIAGVQLDGGPSRELIVALDTPDVTRIEPVPGQALLDRAGMSCFSTPSGFTIDEPGFGDVVETGNLDGDPRPEVIFYALGRDQVAVLFNLELGPLIIPTAVDITGATAIAVADVDGGGDERGELLIGVPLDSLGNGEGRVAVFDVVASEPNAPRLELRSFLRDSTTFDGQLYGRSLATAGFRRGQAITQLPIIGASEEVFAVFQADPEGEDPR